MSTDPLPTHLSDAVLDSHPSQPSESSGGFAFPYPSPYLPPTASSFKENSNIFVFNGPLYFSISGGSFELKTSKSKKLNSVLTDVLSPLAKTPEPKHKPKSRTDADARFEELEIRPDLLKGFESSTSPRLEPETSPIGDEQTVKRGFEDAKQTDAAEASEVSVPTEPANVPEEEARAAPQIDPRIGLADFFQKSQRY